MDETSSRKAAHRPQMGYSPNRGGRPTAYGVRGRERLSVEENTAGRDQWILARRRRKRGEEE